MGLLLVLVEVVAVLVEHQAHLDLVLPEQLAKETMAGMLQHRPHIRPEVVAAQALLEQLVLDQHLVLAAAVFYINNLVNGEVQVAILGAVAVAQPVQVIVHQLVLADLVEGELAELDQLLVLLVLQIQVVAVVEQVS
jgi:hypothetical protein